MPETLSLYVCKPSGVDSDVAPEGAENLFVLVPIPADPTLGKGGIDGGGDAAIEALADRVIAQIADWAGIPDLAERVVLRRTVGPGRLRRRPQLVEGHRPSAPRTPCGRARSSAPAT